MTIVMMMVAEMRSTIHTVSTVLQCMCADEDA